MVKCTFSTISERDMDMLFLNAFSTEEEFLQLFIKKTDIKNSSKAIINSIELSRTERGLGESDITVVFSIGKKTYGLLIEDKIDAIAMPEQHSRYIKRGNKGIEDGQFDEYEVFIICPEKYYLANNEAKKYEHVVYYEECLAYFEVHQSPINEIRKQQIINAIDKAKRPPQVILNEKANEFFKNYLEYQKENYPQLDIRTKDTSNGYWVRYSVNNPNASIHHKIPQGFVDLYIKNKECSIEYLQSLAVWLNEHGFKNVKAESFDKSLGLRMNVPILKMSEPFESTTEYDLKMCFGAIDEFTKLASIIKTIKKCC